MPGTLPVPNRRAIELVLWTATALEAQIPPASKFDRKNYFYPDLPKGYQISQYDLPFSIGGVLPIGDRELRIRRAHLEEDTGSLRHAGDSLHMAPESLVDLNRAGIPLMEIVTEPELYSAEDVRNYALMLRHLMRWLDVSDADMENGQLRIEPNISVRRVGTSELGTKTELKNLNSIRSVYLAVEHEIQRQKAALDSGAQVIQETRGWSEPEKRTFSQRSKEFAEDYRYFPEPDIPPIYLDQTLLHEFHRTMPELPWKRFARLQAQYGLTADDATDVTVERRWADLFEAVVEAGVQPKPAANWIIQERPEIPADRLAELIKLVAAGRINRDQGRQVLQEATTTDRTPAEIVRERGLEQLSDEADLAAVVDQVIGQNPQAVADFQAGKQQALGALLGAVKAATGGRANMGLASSLLRERLTR